MQAILSDIEPGGGSGDEPYSLPADVEFVFVLAGQLQITVAGEHVTLEQGDAFTFPASIQHTFGVPRGRWPAPGCSGCSRPPCPTPAPTCSGPPRPRDDNGRGRVGDGAAGPYCGLSRCEQGWYRRDAQVSGADRGAGSGAGAGLADRGAAVRRHRDAAAGRHGDPGGGRRHPPRRGRPGGVPRRRPPGGRGPAGDHAGADRRAHARVGPRSADREGRRGAAAGDRGPLPAGRTPRLPALRRDHHPGLRVAGTDAADRPGRPCAMARSAVPGC